MLCVFVGGAWLVSCGGSALSDTEALRMLNDDRNYTGMNAWYVEETIENTARGRAFAQAISDDYLRLGGHPNTGNDTDPYWRLITTTEKGRALFDAKEARVLSRVDQAGRPAGQYHHMSVKTHYTEAAKIVDRKSNSDGSVTIRFETTTSASQRLKAIPYLAPLIDEAEKSGDKTVKTRTEIHTARFEKWDKGWKIAPN